MSDSKTIAEIDREIGILNSYFKKNKFQYLRHSGSINLLANDRTKDISLGNTKTELYYQLLTVNRVLEQLQQEGLLK